MLRFALDKLTLADFPAHTACTVFMTGCNLRCPFCHNAPLVFSRADTADESEILRFLEKRAGLLDGVCISGGEPLLQDIEPFVDSAKALGYLVKLDTNGTMPDRLERLISKLDYIAMDIKSSPERYCEAAGAEVNLDDIRRSIALVKSVDGEFRTTVTRELHDHQTLIDAAQMISGAKRYFLQKFVDSGDLVSGGMSAYSDDEMQSLANSVRPYVGSVTVR